MEHLSIAIDRPLYCAKVLIADPAGVAAAAAAAASASVGDSI